MKNEGNTELPALNIKQPTEVDGHMIVARDLFRGVEVLSKSPNIHPRSCVLIAAHSLECTLKAFLQHKGKKKEIYSSETRHNVIGLWNMAHKEGLNISEKIPDWFMILNEGHNKPYGFRYQKGEGKNVVHITQTPPLIPMTGELKKLIDTVELAVKA